ncbi:glycosyltransferase 87 family protein [Streptomyces sp. NPDC054933]
MNGRSGMIQRWLWRHAGVVCAVSLALRPLTELGHGPRMIDLQVYRVAAPHLLTGDLYGFRLYESGPGMFPLPFTYPPFAALVFLPLRTVPWLVLACAWQVLSVVCLAALVSGCLRLAGEPGWRDPRGRRRILLWTAVVLWAEPVHATLWFGQVNLILAAVVVFSLARRSALGAGLGVGAAAGVKLTPAVTALYFLAHRRWSAAWWSAAGLAATVAAAWWVAPRVADQFWFHVLADTSRIGPVASATNQSLRGALSRTLGHDVGLTAPWWVAVSLAAILALAACLRSARRGDRLGTLVAVQLFGLLASPVSWCHHWVWCVAALIALFHAPARGRGHTVALTAWAVALGSHVISWLVAAQPSIWAIPRPWYLAALGWIYPVCTVLTFTALAVPAPRRRQAPVARPAVAAPLE